MMWKILRHPHGRYRDNMGCFDICFPKFVVELRDDRKAWANPNFYCGSGTFVGQDGCSSVETVCVGRLTWALE